MKKRFKAFLGAMSICAFAAGPVFSADFKILIATWRGCEEACQGLQEYLIGTHSSYEFILRDADRDVSQVPEFLQEARAENVDLIVSWGTSVTRAIAGKLDALDDPSFNHDIPQIFMIVADPVGAGIIESLDQTGRDNITGTFNRMPEAVTIETMRSYLPEFMHLGMLYNSDEPNSVLKHDELQSLSIATEFQFTSLDIAPDKDTGPNPDMIAPAMKELASAGVDFVYLGSSSFLRSNGEIFGSAALANSLPTLSPYEDMVRAGDALISVAARYAEVGQLAGRQVERILVEGKTPGDLPVLSMTNFAVTINLSTAKKLGVFPPIGLLQIAETVN